MVQNQTICLTMPTRNSEGRKSKKDNKKRGSSLKKAVPEKRKISVCATSTAEGKVEAQLQKSDNGGKQEPEKEGKVTSLVEYLKIKRLEERRAKEKQAEEDKERFLKEAAEKKAAEREEIIKQAKRMFLYRKPMCRRINRALLMSECLRELDAQIKFRETLKNPDREMELAYVNLMKADVEKYEAEMKEKMEKQMEIRRNYAADLKRQIEENRIDATTKEREEFEADKLDQINMKKRLEEIKEYETQQLRDKKEKLRKLFEDAIEEKKQFELQFKREEEFEDRATEIYRNAKERIQKMHKSMALKERKERERKAQLMGEKDRILVKSTNELEEKIYRKAVEEQEERYREMQRNKEEREHRLRKEIHDYRAAATAAKSEQLREKNDLKIWEMMQRFKKVEYDKEWEAEERKRMWSEKMECAEKLRKLMGEKEARDHMEKLEMEDAAALAKKIMDKENQRVLDYGEEVLNESKGVRPLYPILKAVKECKEEMGLVAPKKTGKIIDPECKKKRRVPLKCTKFVPDDKILYL